MPASASTPSSAPESLRGLFFHLLPMLASARMKANESSAYQCCISSMRIISCQCPRVHLQLTCMRRHKRHVLPRLLVPPCAHLQQTHVSFHKRHVLPRLLVPPCAHLQQTHVSLHKPRRIPPRRCGTGRIFLEIPVAARDLTHPSAHLHIQYDCCRDQRRMSTYSHASSYSAIPTGPRPVGTTEIFRFG
jgi:hypothetical protein